MHRLKSQSGVSLIELMIVVFTGGLLLVTAMGLMLNVSSTSSNFTQSLDTEIEELSAVNAVQIMFAQATEVKYYTAGAMNTYTAATGVGAIRDYDSNTDFATNPVSTLAIFMRDRQVSTLTTTSTLTSNLVPTGVFFQAPTPTTFGVLYIALDDPLVPARGQLHFDGLVRVRIRNVSTYSPYATSPNPGDPVTSFDMELTFRRFLGTVPPDAHMFCPQPNLAACAGIGAFKDVARVFKVNLRNNILAASPNSPPATPLGGRMFDLIHFFALGRPKDLR